jgi:hypothetical protein
MITVQRNPDLTPGAMRVFVVYWAGNYEWEIHSIHTSEEGAIREAERMAGGDQTTGYGVKEHELR